jgi:hypothetical protein
MTDREMFDELFANPSEFYVAAVALIIGAILAIIGLVLIIVLLARAWGLA